MSRMLVQIKKGNDWRVTKPSKKLIRYSCLFRPFFDSIQLLLYPQRSVQIFSTAALPDFLLSEILSISPDIIHLHWINYGFFQLQTLKKIYCPIIWTFHDMWPFTGGCHVDNNCGRFVHKCGNCPQLGSKKMKDLSYRIWRKKEQTLRDININIVAPSDWMVSCARKSSLFNNQKINLIPNGINLKIFKPVPKSAARAIWNLPQNKKILLFGSINALRDRNKGFHLLQEALRSLSQSDNISKIELAIFGADAPQKPLDLGFKCHFLGKLYDEVSIATLYSAADVTIVPSMQESFGQTASEALACGCPVVAFETTGLLDIINHCKNGYLSQPFIPEDLAKGILWVLADKNRHQNLCIAARKKAINDYDLQKVSHQYKELYRDILHQ